MGVDVANLDYQDDILFNLFVDKLNENEETNERDEGGSLSEDIVVSDEGDVDVSFLSDKGEDLAYAPIFNPNDLYNPILKLDLVFRT